MARKNKSPSDASSLLASSRGTLAQLATKTNFLSQLEDIVRQTCPDLPAQVWNISNFRQNTCVIGVASAVWAQRLQFERMNICQQLSKLTQGEFTHIEIKVRPFGQNGQVANNEEKPKPKKHLSEKTAAQLNEVAENAPESLKKKLQKLANLANK